MKQLTVFTPTYNRAYCLDKLYESLKNQSSKDFIWLIIDDGSTDNTHELVTDWINEGHLRIHYHWQSNQGMHGAHNTAYELIQSELNVCIDSDDFMPTDAVEKILTFWKMHGSEEVSGIIGLDSDSSNEIIGSKMPAGIKTSTLFDLYNRHGVTGDKKLVYRTALTKQYPYPLFKNERYVGLDYKYYKLDQTYEMLVMNEVLCCVEYRSDGSTQNMLYQYRKNPLGFTFYRKELMQLPFAGSMFKFRQAIHYVSSSLLSRNRNFFKDSPQKWLTVSALPFGLMLYIYILTKTRAVNVP
ncbi:Glycosyltransferase involved in cell wall bisynthesis [Lentibacillus persicus]|uniref:Glycosyltransferase involved in cell wall bisynthesis n=1 Tax=Lentibacillus persicus TaxID=640948 RepID=A0A1I1U8W3_9BACI|nr:glycosyltransferase family 2 protein [Lentibacillus persicus]SFD67296.1 Glycosyltransferase involved in cell wall bisynthesis [Lentibacillus persicus]